VSVQSRALRVALAAVCARCGEEESLAAAQAHLRRALDHRYSLSIRQHTSAYVSIRQHTLSYVSILSLSVSLTAGGGVRQREERDRGGRHRGERRLVPLPAGAHAVRLCYAWRSACSWLRGFGFGVGFGFGFGLGFGLGFRGT
jgi:hypothetical protein